MKQYLDFHAQPPKSSHHVTPNIAYHQSKRQLIQSMSLGGRPAVQPKKSQPQVRRGVFMDMAPSRIFTSGAPPARKMQARQAKATITVPMNQPERMMHKKPGTRQEPARTLPANLETVDRGTQQNRTAILQQPDSLSRKLSLQHYVSSFVRGVKRLVSSSVHRH